MAAVYGTFAGGSVAARPHLVDRVLDRGGRTLYKAAGDRRRVLSPQVTADATYAMQQVVLRGTGRAAQLAAGRQGRHHRRVPLGVVLRLRPPHRRGGGHVPW